MNKTSLSQQIISYIHHSTKIEAIEEIVALILQAYKDADDDSDARIFHCPLRKARKRSQDRFCYVQDILAGGVSYWTAKTRAADNGGESFSQLENEKIFLTTHVISPESTRLRKAKYRDDNAKSNTGLIHQATLVFDDVAEPPKPSGLANKLNVLIYVYSPHSSQSQGSPSQFKILVPFENNNGYHVNLDLDQFLARYSKIDTQTPLDQAWPKLRRKMRQAEEEQENDSKS